MKGHGVPGSFMAGNTFGTLYRVTTFGESHGAGLGAVIDGCPAGLALSEEDIQAFLDRRAPGRAAFATKRKEPDRCRILSGVFGGKTTGTPIMVLIENTDQRSGDYDAVRNIYRPGHADYTYDMKYGFRDYRGGGRSSGRETTGRVIGGAVASKILAEFGVEVHAFTESVGPVRISPERFDLSACAENPLCMPDREAAELAAAYLRELAAAGDSSGGRVGCLVKGVPAGLGEPVFDKLDAELAKAVMSIGAVKGIEFGAGFRAAEMTGSEDNDPFRMAADAGGELKTVKEKNDAGGILGGMSDGAEIRFSAAVKATPSISRPQKTVTRDGQETEVTVHGRHDPVIMPRAAVVVECMTACVVLDMLMRNAVCSMDRLKGAYGHEKSPADRA